MLVETLKQAKRVVVLVVGSSVVLLGVVMLVTPGPGWLAIFLGLSILSAEFVWARRLLKRMKRAGARIADTVLPEKRGPQVKA